MFDTAVRLAKLSVAIFCAASSLLCARADDTWEYWASVPTVNASAPKLATDGTNIYFSTLLDGVYRATLDDRNFSLMPMTGFPLWDANTNTNGFAAQNIATTPQGG